MAQLSLPYVTTGKINISAVSSLFKNFLHSHRDSSFDLFGAIAILGDKRVTVSKPYPSI